MLSVLQVTLHARFFHLKHLNWEILTRGDVPQIDEFNEIGSLPSALWVSPPWCFEHRALSASAALGWFYHFRMIFHCWRGGDLVLQDSVQPVACAKKNKSSSTFSFPWIFFFKFIFKAPSNFQFLFLQFLILELQNAWLLLLSPPLSSPFLKTWPKV